VADGGLGRRRGSAAVRQPVDLRVLAINAALLRRKSL
jgi:hypothetical protein